MKKEFIITIIVSVILGGFYFYTQDQKQESIERQHQATLELEQERLREETVARKYRENKYQECIDDAETRYFRFAELNGTRKEDGSINAPWEIWDRAEKRKAQEELVCNQQWK